MLHIRMNVNGRHEICTVCGAKRLLKVRKHCLQPDSKWYNPTTGYIGGRCPGKPKTISAVIGEIKQRPPLIIGENNGFGVYQYDEQGGTMTAEEVAYEEGRRRGQEEGFQEGYEKGREDGYQEGYAEGSVTGRREGYDQGYEEGHREW